jgi:hypothetical protein
MALAGSGIVAIWNDITDEGRDNFYEWHNREHIPERVGIRGFLRGRRYRAEPGDGQPAYFTLYEVTDTDVLSGPEYLARLNAPTPWTTDSVRHFRNTARSLCGIEWTRGAGSGGFIATLRFDCDPAHDESVLRRLTEAFDRLLGEAAIVATHVCRADLTASRAKTAEQKGRPENAVPRWVVLVETSTEAAARASFAGPLGATLLDGVHPDSPERGLYRLQFDLIRQPASA